ncbi:very short patch repair endonuclease [Nannocystis punicea]|uniref:very short patch repair endonuclease n=1 Tax=Nannocystis punicea TaxID=2995304 RepID=UPI0035307DE3
MRELRDETLQPSARVSAVMRKVRVRGTEPEIAVRRMLHSLGFRFRVQPTRLPGRPDITNLSKRWCIFVHGCFWHGHECKRGSLPKRNQSFWQRKILGNRKRDALVEQELRSRGFRVLTVWQCELGTEELKQRLIAFVRGGQCWSAYEDGRVAPRE